MEDWKIIYKTTNGMTAEIIKGMLLENEIDCVALNKKDSELLFGEINIYVHPDNVEQANELINNFDIE